MDLKKAKCMTCIIKLKKSNISKRRLYINFDESNYKNINKYIENNKNNDDILNYEKIKREINLIKHNINKKVKKVDEERGIIDNEKLEREKIKSDLEQERFDKKRLEEYELNLKNENI